MTPPKAVVVAGTEQTAEPRWRRLAFRSLALLLSIVAALIIAESGVRLFVPQPLSAANYYAPDELIGFALQPNYEGEIVTGEYSMRVHVNSLGCRGAELNVTDGSAAPILLLGDSYMFGYGVTDSETMAAQLYSLLRDRSPIGATCTVVNAGVAGYGPVQYRHRYAQLRNVVQPSVVIIGVYVGNDVFDCVWDKTHLRVLNGYLISPHASNATALRFWIKKNSHLYRIASAVSQRIRVRNGQRERSYEEMLGVLFVDREWEEGVAERNAWSRFEVEMEALIDAIRKDGAEPLPVVLPMRLQVDDGNWERYAAGVLAKDWHPRRFLPQQKMRELFARLDVNYVDLTSAIVEGGAADLFYVVDGHWNARGHRVAATVVASRLNELLARRTP